MHRSHPALCLQSIQSAHYPNTEDAGVGLFGTSYHPEVPRHYLGSRWGLSDRSQNDSRLLETRFLLQCPRSLQKMVGQEREGGEGERERDRGRERERERGREREGERVSFSVQRHSILYLYPFVMLLVILPVLILTALPSVVPGQGATQLSCVWAYPWAICITPHCVYV